MAKPIIKAMTPFDKDTNYLVGFVWKGDMAYNNRLYIYDSETMNLVYDHVYPTNYYRLNHEIPAGTLQNGKKYAAQIQVIDSSGVASELSDKYYFWVLAKPTFYFEGLSSTVPNEINNSSYTATLYYSQDNNDTLDTYQFFLYSSVKEQLDASEVFQNSSSKRYTFRSLENDTNYYIRAIGTTKKNIPMDTGFVPIYARYTDPSFYSRMYAKVNEVVGTVDYSTNVINIESDLGSAAYDYEEGYVNLVEYNGDVRFDIATDSIIYPSRISAKYINLDFQEQTQYVDDYNHLIISNYSEITKIIVEGAYKTVRLPNLVVGNYMPGDFQVIDRIGLSLNGVDVSNLTVSHPLRRVPNRYYDRIEIDAYGKRVLYKNISNITILGTLTPSSTGKIKNNYGRWMVVLYYNVVGAKKLAGAGNLVCNNLPVNTETTSVFLTDDGRIGIKFDYTETLVDRESKALAWLNEHPLKILFPMETEQVIYLDTVQMPPMKSNKSVRYSTNFKIPAETTTIAIKMKEAYKNAEILRVQHDGQDEFVVSSAIYDGIGGESLRYKLRAFGNPSDYILYSEPLKFKRWDIVTLYVRRINGIYQMKVFIEEVNPNALHNVWFLTSEPRDGVSERDMWLDMGYPTEFVNKDTAIRFYQDINPRSIMSNLNNYGTLWIGG